MKDKPSISVVILAYNAERTIAQCFDAITNQKTSVPYEILVVYRQSSDGTLDIIEKYPHIRVILQPDNSPGVSSARNIGVKNTKASIVAFTDADCVVPMDWIERIANVLLHNYEIDAVGGPLVGTGNESTWIARVGGYVAEAHGTIGKIATNNCAIKKNLFYKIGGFDEHLITGEDVDFSWRLEQSGSRILFDQHLRVVHLWRDTIKDFIQEQYAYGKGRGMLIDRYPNKYPIIERYAIFVLFIFILYGLIVSWIVFINNLLAICLFAFGGISASCIVIGRRRDLSKKIIRTRGMLFFLQCLIVYLFIDVANILGIAFVKLRRCKS